MKKWSLETVVEQLNAKSWELLNEDMEDTPEVEAFIARLVSADFDRRRQSVNMPGQVTLDEAIADAQDEEQ